MAIYHLGKKKSTQSDLFEKICRAKQLIDNNPGQELNIQILAKEAMLSEFHFYRCFKGIVGLPPYQYYIKAKIARSAELIMQSNMDLTQIAHQMGFSELSCFSRTFKKVYGVPPLIFKKKMLAHLSEQTITVYNN